MKNSMDEEMDSLDQMKEFLAHHNLGDNGYGVYRFNAQVFGKVGVRNMQFISDVQMAIQNGIDTGTIALYAAANDCPGEFYAKWQRYVFEPNGGQLVITDTHPQHGKYELFVKPL